MDRLRYSVILIIVVAFAVGIWTRYLAIFSVETSTPVEINPALLDAGLQLTGTFGEPFGDLTGFEVSLSLVRFVLPPLGRPAPFLAPPFGIAI
jgi:hypothetical protein